MSTHARPLAERLAAASDDELTALFARRGIRPDVGWQDFFDAAEALLDPASIARMLTRLTRAEAAALHAATGTPESRVVGPELEALRRLALVRDDGEVLPPVVDAVAERPTPAPPVEAEPESADEREAAHAAERAFTTVSSVADLLLVARDRPLTLLVGGGLSAGEKRALAEAGLVSDDADHLVALALAARLVVVEERVLRATVRADAWLRSSAADRWTALATGFRRTLPRGLRTPAGGWIPLDGWGTAHPWDPSWEQRSSELLAHAALLGLVGDGGREPSWAQGLREGAEADAAALARMLPAEVDRIFLQNDLSAIAPGSLVPALDVRLRTLAERESAAQASSYRFTPESVARAFVAGETEDSIVEFLEALSLTGIPQPLRYLVAQTAQRHGLVKVSTDPDTRRTRIESADPHLIEALAVDQALRPLGLTRDAGRLTTRVGQDTVYWALTDARYPATLVDEHGLPVTADRAPAASDVDDVASDYAPLIAALRSHQGPDADAAWLDRELEAAVRARALLRVTVGMPDGSTRDLTLEATGLGGGRLRGRDRAADVERTLPVASIRAATVIDR